MKNKTQKVLSLLFVSALLAGCGAKTSASATDSADTSTSVPPSSHTSVSVTQSFTVPADVDLNVGETSQITPSNLVGVSVSDFSYSSYDETIATVSNVGLITAVAEGETTVLVRAGEARRVISVTVSDPNKLNNVSYNKYKNIAAIDADNSSIDYTGAPLMNFAWDGGTQDSTNRKVDFEGTAADTTVILRQSTFEHAFVTNGDYVVVMTTGDDSALTSSTAREGAAATVYAKVEVSEYANSFRLWGWASKSDVEVSRASGEGKFRVVAYEFNNDYTSYTSNVLKASDKGTLNQDENGWISFEDVSNVSTGQIDGAPADNMFVYEVANSDYNLKGKTFILAVEAAEVANTKGPSGTNIASRFGIKRMGFICDAKPDFSITPTSHEIYANETVQISPLSIGAASEGTYSYVSSNEAVATVSSTGLVTAKDVAERGTTTITVTNNNVANKSVEVTITVNPTPVQSFSLPAEIVLGVGETSQITPTDVVACDGFTYESSEKGIFTVSETGLVTATGVGNANVKVTSGELTKYTVVKVTSAATILGLSREAAGSMASFTNTGGFPGAWDFAWSGGVTADKIDADNSKMDQALIRMYQTGQGTQNNVAPNDIELISGIGGTRTDVVQNSVYVKTDISASAGTFRLWGRAAAANADMLGEAKFRIVVYVDNGSSYDAHILPLAGSEGYGADSVKHDSVTGMVNLASTEPGAFLVFSVPNEIKGATGAFVVIESYSIANDDNLQTRGYVRRFGFDA